MICFHLNAQTLISPKMSKQTEKICSDKITKRLSAPITKEILIEFCE